MQREIGIPETKHAIAILGKPPVANHIALAFRVLRAIELDNQSGLETSKVGNVRADRNLAAKLHPLEASISQDRPHTLLDLGLSSPERFRKGPGPLRNLDCTVRGRPLIRPSATFSRKGRRRWNRSLSRDSLLPSREKVARRSRDG
jgi:hypothetical protein